MESLKLGLKYKTIIALKKIVVICFIFFYCIWIFHLFYIELDVAETLQQRCNSLEIAGRILSLQMYFLILNWF